MQKTQNDVSIDAIASGFRSGFGERASISFCLESAISCGFRYSIAEMASISSRGGYVHAFTYDYVKTRPEHPAPHDLLSSGGNEVCFATTPPDMEASCKASQQSGYATRYIFSAKELDDETQYSYFGARYYDSDLSVWLSVDPLSDKFPDISPYSFSSNRPVVYCDPNGLYPWPMVIGLYAHVAFAMEMNGKRDASGRGTWRSEYVINKSNRADLLFFGNNNTGSVWELKPSSHQSGTNLLAAIVQIGRYVLNANRDISKYKWSAGSSNGNPVPFEGTMVKSFKNYTFTYTIGDAQKGLIFYSYQRNNTKEVPVSMPQSQPENQDNPQLLLDPVLDDRRSPIPIAPIAAVSIPEVIGSFVTRMLCPILVFPPLLERESNPIDSPTQIEM